MTAGRELDARVNHRIFGAPPPRDVEAFTVAGYWAAGDRKFIHCPLYSTNMDDALKVREVVAGWYESHRQIFMARLYVAVRERVGFFEESELFLNVEPVDICVAALEASEMR